jgi:hypothetical protein
MTLLPIWHSPQRPLDQPCQLLMVAQACISTILGSAQWQCEESLLLPVAPVYNRY